MDLTPLIERLRDNEDLFGEIYLECARLFPAEQKEFIALAKEEQGHAKIFNTILRNVAQDPSHWEIGQLSLATVEVLHKQIKTALLEIKCGKVDPRYAITFMRSMEQGMSERSLEKVLKTANPLFAEMLQQITKGFTVHLARLQDLERRLFKPSPKVPEFTVR